ncbi:serine/threonine-protein kinase [Streptomyces marispadix]|uniref:Serine/threonine protein kinase n=1 Tax=Streptomyces marispadix TaxID=2922868 RepID=A0ABS9SVF5_9ACTN|nr:serine/threonine-protein kinase [Streptomyces marispadix]MCH6160041.1 serine/threonine protein kinase [Streptomyces marispadix]
MKPLEAGDPRVVGPYRLTFRLGSGGMGRVFLGQSPAGRRVAVKVVREDLASSSGFRERFRREAKLAMRAGGFWTAQVVDADPDAAVPWIASQYVDGPSLAERVARHGPLDEEEVRRLTGGLAEALASFHKTGLVHRDLKPSNVLLVDDGPRVIDFGVSKAFETLETAGSTDLTRAGTILGTPGFMSPEQAQGQPAGPPADVFSLGSLLVYAATGNGPFGEGPSHTLLFRVVYEEPDLGATPYGLRELALDCLRKAPEDRPSAAALVSRLAHQRPRSPIRAPRTEPPERSRGRTRRRAVRMRTRRRPPARSKGVRPARRPRRGRPRRTRGKRR